MWENKTEISVIAHNFTGFDAFFIFNGFQATTWGTKDINIGGSNLTNFNYVNINGGGIKFIDTLKYYQQSLASLINTLTDKEKKAVKQLRKQFLTKNDYFSTVWIYLSPIQQAKVLDIVGRGKGVIPYEKIVDINSLDLKPEFEFFEQTDFFSELINSAVSDESYENSNYLFRTLKMRNISDMNDLYNFQDVALLCEIVENRFQIMQVEYGFNPRKCNSVSTLSGCIEHEMSKIIIALPTTKKLVSMFEETLTGGLSAVNTQLAFDTEILLTNCTDEENLLKKDYSYKVCYDLKFDGEEQGTYRVISKILKIDENNQYNFAMTKPMPTGCIQVDEDITWRTFNLLLENVDLDYQIRQLYVADIEFDFKNAALKQLTNNEICPPIIEKQKVTDIFERSIYHFLEHHNVLNSGNQCLILQPKNLTQLCSKRDISLFILNTYVS